MAIIPPSALENLKHLLEKELATSGDGRPNIESFELVKELGMQVARLLGVWCTTKCLADLSATIIQVKAMVELKKDLPDPRIDHSSLAPAKDCSNLAVLKQKPVNLQLRLREECISAKEAISAWLWLDCEGSLFFVVA